ncbi:unnamed protein product [Calicophoron daubneyi]|uniref:snRNA-activating protein complex subunit 4 n=1 Tax=Calicophoron daubneyi TaxID=300641 RepID=A0AAV2TFQ0_CALDB
MTEENSTVDADFTKCAILNKAVQHVLPEIFKSIKDEMNYLKARKADLESGGSLCLTPGNVVRKPFLTLETGEAPPLNEDAKARVGRNEINLTDARSAALKHWQKKERISLVTGVAACAYARRVELLASKRELLISKIAANRCKEVNEASMGSGDFKSNIGINAGFLSSLRDTEDQLSQMRALPPTPSKWLVSSVVSATSSAGNGKGYMHYEATSNSLWERRILKRYGSRKFIRQYNSKAWLSLLADAEQLLTGAEWDEIANHKLRGATSGENVHLTWYHLLRPDINLSSWTSEEDQKLMGLVDRFGQHGKWEEIADNLGGGRTAFSCFQRWQTSLNSSFRLHRPWSPAEDTALVDILKKLLEKHPPALIEWEVVAAYHATRSACECRSRALYILPAFAKVSLKIPPPEDLLASTSYRRYSIMGRPFSVSEDLQLLMGIQRYGIGGGRVGTGGGLGLGSWALIATALPDRSPKTCQQRYCELCEQLQPWTYAEDRNLYRWGLQNKTFSDDIYVIRNCVEYFPGRSPFALQRRLKMLNKWAQVWTSLRTLMNYRMNTKASARNCSVVRGETEATTSGTEDRIGNVPVDTLGELRELLLCSQFSAHFIAQLRNCGVEDAEAEAFRLLMTWKPSDKVSGLEASADEPITSKNSRLEFAQLLEDLASEALVPRSLTAEGMENNDGVTKPNAVSTDMDSHHSVSLHEAKQIIMRTQYLFQLRQILTGPVRRYLFCLCCPLSSRNYNTRSRPAAAAASNAVDAGSSEQVPTQAKKRTFVSDRIRRASTLLEDESLFCSALDKALKDEAVVNVLKKPPKICHVNGIAKIVARIMITGQSEPQSAAPEVPPPSKRRKTEPVSSLKCRQGSVVMRTPPKTTPVDVDASTSSAARVTRRKVRRKAKPQPVRERTPWESTALRLSRDGPIPMSKRIKLLQIRRLLQLFGIKRKSRCNAYAVGLNQWTQEKERKSVFPRELTTNDRFVPPIFRLLPERITAAVFTEPQLITPQCLNAARSCLRHGLGLQTEPSPRKEDRGSRKSGTDSQPVTPAATSQQNDVPQPSTSRQWPVPPPRFPSSKEVAPPQILPPTYASLLGLKSILLHLPNLVRTGGGRLSQFVEVREILNSVSNNKSAVQNYLQNAQSYNLNVANTLVSPAYCRFIAVGLSLLLWPALLASIPGQSFVDAAKRSWAEAFSRLPQQIVEHHPVRPKITVRSHSKGDKGDSDSDSSYEGSESVSPASPPTPPPKRTQPSLIRTGHRVRRLLRFTHDCSVRFRVTSSDPTEKFFLGFPTEIKTLYASGFRPVSIYRAKK